MITAIGIDIGGTKVAAGLVDAGGSLLRRCRFSTPGRPEDAVEQLKQGIAPWLEERAEGNHVVGCGLASPGPLDLEAGAIERGVNLPGWANFPLVEQVEQALHLPVTMLNDALAAALAESRLGSGKREDPVLYLTISTGIGGGLISGGIPYQGASGNAAEVGHMTMESDGRLCGCGRRGCLEAYASGTAIAKAAEQALERQTKRPAWAPDDGPPAAEDVVKGVDDDETLAVSVWNDALAVLSRGLADLIHLYDPAVIVLGGGVTQAGELLFDPLRRQVAEQTLGPKRVPIRRAALAGGVGVIGAALAALEPGNDPG